MPIPERVHLPTRLGDLEIQITDDGSRTLIRPSDRVAYHSGCGARSETQHVYLINSGVQDRLLRSQPTRVLEIGLGTGLGLLCTVDVAMQNGCRLDYVAYECSPLPSDVIENMAFEDALKTPSLFDGFVEQMQLVATEETDVRSWSPATDISVELRLADLLKCFPLRQGTYHAVYFDPFDPANNPELWTEDVFAELFAALCSGGRLTTYCVKRSVRDAFQSVGFEVERVPGPPGGKREVLVAIRP